MQEENLCNALFFFFPFVHRTRIRDGFLLAPVLAFLSVSCAPPLDPQADAQEVQQVCEASVAALNAADVEALMALLDQDAVLVAEESPPLIRPEAIRAHHQAFFDKFKAELRVNHEKVIVAGDWAFYYGTVTGTLTSALQGEPREITARTYDILRRQSDNSWKYTRLTAIASAAAVRQVEPERAPNPERKN